MARGVVDRQSDLVSVSAHQNELDERGQQGDDDEMQNGAGQGEPPQARSACHADCGGLPDGGRGREAPDSSVSGEDDARAQEADARHDLRSHSRGIVAGDAVDEDVGEAVLGNEHHQACGEADDGLGADTRAFASDLTFEADGCREDEGEEHPPDAHEGLRHRNLLRWRGWV